MERQHSEPRGWGRMQRRVRRLAPHPVRQADLAVFRALARARIPLLGPLLPRLSTAANHSRLWMVLALLMGAFGGRFGRRAAVRGLFAVAVTSTVTNLPAKLLTGRQRPDIELVPAVRRLRRIPSSTSFPSGHSASAFAFATGASMELPALSAGLLPLAAAVATSRVYTGVHYPGDALVGSAFGVAIARWTTRPWPLIDLAPVAAPQVGELPLGEDGTGMTVVVNAGAGNGLQEDIAEVLRRDLPGAEVVEVAEGDDLAEVLERACETAAVLGVAGGDGSVSAAAAIAQQTGTPLAVFPAGTLNFLAKTIGMDQTGAVDAVRHGHAVAVDMAEIAGRPFINAARLGAFATIVRERERWEDTLTKWPAGIVALVRVLTTHKPIDLEIDGRPRRIWMGFIGNCTFWSPGIAPTQRRRLDDGLLDVRIVRADLPWARTRVLVGLLSGRLHRSPAFESWTAEEVEVRSASGPLTVVTDGEDWDGPAAFTIRKRQDPLVVLRPEQD